MNGIQIRVPGTEEQFKQMTGQCELTEALFAQTLARRIEGMKAEEAIEFILSWFQSVRHMAQAALMSSGIKTSVEPIGMSGEVLDDAHTIAVAITEATRLMDAKRVAPGKFLDRLRSILDPMPTPPKEGYTLSESVAWSDGWWAGHKAAHGAKPDGS